MRADRVLLSMCGAMVLSALAVAPTLAQDFPSKPVTFITPAAAGNSPDVVGRIVADRLSQMWKQQVVIINRPGAGGLIAAQAAAASNVEKDGYTLYMSQASTFNVLPIQQEGKMPFDLMKTFAPIGMIGEQPIAVAVNKDVAAKNVKELIDLANKTQGGMLFGATNRGGQAHLTGELFRDRSKANISFVHATGAAATVNDVIAGRIPIVFEGLAGLQPGTQSGAIRLLGVAAVKRLPNLPNLPAINETVPGVVSSGWIVMMAPMGVPDAVINKVNADMRKVLAMPDVIERFHTLGTYSRDYTPVQTREFIESEQKLWWPIVREVNKQQAPAPIQRVR
jgi:tripartite-type tricarboxylate transporter receptor subunit TctC